MQQYLILTDTLLNLFSTYIWNTNLTITCSCLRSSGGSPSTLGWVLSQKSSHGLASACPLLPPPTQTFSNTQLFPVPYQWESLASSTLLGMLSLARSTLPISWWSLLPFRILCRHHITWAENLSSVRLWHLGHTGVLAPHRNSWNGFFMSVSSSGWKGLRGSFPVMQSSVFFFLLCTHMSISDCFYHSWGTEGETGLDSPIWLLECEPSLKGRISSSSYSKSPRSSTVPATTLWAV